MDVIHVAEGIESLYNIVIINNIIDITEQRTSDLQSHFIFLSSKSAKI